MSVFNVEAWLNALVAVPLCLIVAVMLWRLSRRSPRIGVLRERAFVQTVVVFFVAMFTLIFHNNDMPVPLLSPDDTKHITRLSTLVLAVISALIWLRLYRHGRTTTDADDASPEAPR